MLGKISIRLRLTLMSVLLLTLCCAGLTLLLNNSADKVVAAVITSPASHVGEPQCEESVPGFIPEAAPVKMPLYTLAAARFNFRMDSVLYMVLMVIGGAALTYYAVGGALKPLKILNEQVKNIHVNNLSEPLPVPTTHDEIAELTTSFNEMTEKLDHAFCLQQQFSASAAHELKTPLAVLQTKVDVFRLQEAHSNSEYEALVSVFEKQLQRLRGLVTNLLSMTQTDHEDENATICLSDVFSDILEELATVADEKNVTLSMKCDTCEIDGNLDSLYRAFYNLVENAIKYNFDGGSVTVKVQEEPSQQVSIQISDTGIGIPDDCKNEIFEPFFRVDKSRSREFGGNGLGLALVKRIVEQHKGTIAVMDNSPCGSRFILTLPHA